jgi:GGDEF domain-containing protein
MKRPLTWVVTAICAAGALGTLYGAWSVMTHASARSLTDLLALAAGFAALAPWSVKLPSGASWRPAMAILTASIFILPPGLTILAALPGLILITALSRGQWWSHLLTIGHVWTGLITGAAIYQAFAAGSALTMPAMLPAAVTALIAHLAVNRILSAAIVAWRQHRPFAEQLRKHRLELNWNHLSLYTVSIVAALLYHHDGLWGVGVTIILLVGLHQSVAYYTRMHLWQQAAMTDGLTGVGNRAAFEEFLHTADQNRLAGTVVMIDMDKFKEVNDEHGHMVGDNLLRELAAALQDGMQSHDRIFRYGGDEFVLFLQHPAGMAGAAQPGFTPGSMGSPSSGTGGAYAPAPAWAWRCSRPTAPAWRRASPWRTAACTMSN